MRKKKVAVGLSGGVDSSLAATMLMKQGYDVVGITMEIYDGAIKVQETQKHACYGPGEQEDIELAQNLCNELKIPYHVFDLKKEYEENVLDYFRREYLIGRTPNPCVVCNHNLKFGFLVDKARENGLDFDYFATGHYARVEQVDGRYLLKKAVDTSKDQTYFLYALRKERLSEIIFPLGGYTKKEVRVLAKEYNLEVAERAESQDFIAGGDYSPLFEKDQVKQGDIINDKGEVLGRHKGIVYYTIGQRKGLGISSPKPLYVLKIDAKNNRVIVTEKAGLFSKGLIASEMNLISIDNVEGSMNIAAKIRQNHKEAKAVMTDFGDGKIKLVFEDPQLSVTPGQVVVIYDGDIVVGGGIIERAIDVDEEK